MRAIACISCLFFTLLFQDGGKIPITTRSDAARSLFLRGRTLNEALKVHEGYALFLQAVAADSDFAMAEYALATTAPNAKERAVHLRRALALVPRVSPGERLLILALQARTGADPALVRQYATELVTQYPGDERAHWVFGNALLAQQQYDTAAAEYRKAIAINPAYSLAYNSLGYAYRPAGKLDAADTAFRRYIALVPNDPNPYDSYAELLMKMGRFDASIAQYQKALTIDPHFGGSFVGIAGDEMFAGRHPEAIAEAKAYYGAARDDGERRTALLAEAVVEVDDGATDKALATMDHSYRIASAIGDTANMSVDGLAIADILLAAGRVAAARSRFEDNHAMVARSHLSPAVKEDDALAQHYDLARVALEQHDLATARTEAAAYLNGATTRRNDARVRQAHELNGLVALAAKQFDESLGQLALADQQNPAVLYAMARANDGKGNGAKASELAGRGREDVRVADAPLRIHPRKGEGTRCSRDSRRHSLGDIWKRWRKTALKRRRLWKPLA